MEPFWLHFGSILAPFWAHSGTDIAWNRVQRPKKSLWDAASIFIDFLVFFHLAAAAGGGAVLASAGVREPAPIFEKRLLGVESQHHFRDLASEASV